MTTAECENQPGGGIHSESTKQKRSLKKSGILFSHSCTLSLRKDRGATASSLTFLPACLPLGKNIRDVQGVWGLPSHVVPLWEGPLGWREQGCDAH